MGQPVKLSDALVMEARIAGEAMQRSIAGQVEFWASLGKEMERIMNGGQITRVREKSVAAQLSEALESVNKPEGRARLAEYLASKPYPRFVAHPTAKDVFIREDADGSRVEGRIVGREFVPLAEPQSSEAA
jgi:hypothetical protein